MDDTNYDHATVLLDISPFALVDGYLCQACELVQAVNKEDPPIVIFKIKSTDKISNDQNTNAGITARKYATLTQWENGAALFRQNQYETGNAAVNNTYAPIDRKLPVLEVTRNSTTAEKLALFRSLFRGRDDVYAHGYLKKNGHIGYTPVCVNEWDPQLCEKSWQHGKSKCSKCKNREFKPLSNRDLVNHFKGTRRDLHDVIGIYVANADCQTYVLVADFDDNGNWKREASAYRDACHQVGLPAAVERSRSGNGAHVWLFFSEPIEARIARQLGTSLITCAMRQTGTISFSAYDRLFPTQDTLPEGGIGNLIALPLQGAAVREGNSLFVDDSFNAYPDQWRYLSSVKKVASEQITSALTALTEPSTIDADDPQSLMKSSRHTSNKYSFSNNARPLSASDFPATGITVIKANVLSVKSAGLSPRAIDAVRRLAVFANPEFYRAQAMHQSVFGKPRVIDLGEKGADAIRIPRGCEDNLRTLASNANVVLNLYDERPAFRSIKLSFKGTLKPEQQHAADALLEHELGILCAPPGFGKTVVGAYLISQIALPTLVIVPNTSLIEQWIERIGTFLDINEKLPPLLTKTGRPSRRKRQLIGQIGAGKNAPSGIIDVATFQSLMETCKSSVQNTESSGADSSIAGERHVKDIVHNYGLVIFDECHHAAAHIPEQVMREVVAKNIYGLSATPKRTDGLEKIVYLHCGPIRYQVDPKAQANEQGFSRVLVPRFTGLRIPIAETDTDNTNPPQTLSLSRVIEALCTSEARNRLIVDDAIEVISKGRTPVILTKRRSHALALAAMLEKHGTRTFLLMGGGSNKERLNAIQQVREVPKNQSYAIVAIGSYLGEGFDEARLDTLLLAAPVSAESALTQYTGRIQRAYAGKTSAIVYDYVDPLIPVLDGMYRKRLKTYRKLGYTLKNEITQAGKSNTGSSPVIANKTLSASKNEPPRPWDGLYGITDYIPAMDYDLANAVQFILIRASHINQQRINQLAHTLQAAISHGTRISILLNRPHNEQALTRNEEAVKHLHALGCNATLTEGIHANIVVIDKAIVWYGSLPPLAFAQKDDCSLRVTSAEIAKGICES